MSSGGEAHPRAIAVLPLALVASMVVLAILLEVFVLHHAQLLAKLPLIVALLLAARRRPPG